MNKFVIITNTETPKDTARLRLSNVDYHSMLVNKSNTCYGGGMFFLRNEDKNGNPVKQLCLHGSSSDFGRPQFDKFKKFELDEDFEEYQVLWLGEFLYDNKKEIDLTSKIVWGFYL